MAKDTVAALLEAIEACEGSQTELARRISTPERTITQAHIWNWLNRDEHAAPESVLDIERETGVSRHRLRPDVFGPEPKSKSSARATA